MSAAQLAVQELRQSLAELIPTLLASLSRLRQEQHDQLTLTPTDRVFNTLRPLVASADVTRTFQAYSAPPQNDQAQRTLIHSLLLETTKNALEEIVTDAASDSSESHLADGTLSPAALAEIFDRLDIVLVFSVESLVDQYVLLQIVDELLEVNTIPICSQLFGYCESRLVNTKVKFSSLALIRTCNELLSRLSKPSEMHTVLAGRILTLLALVTGLDNRGGLNFRGEYNVDNQTVIDGPDETETGQNAAIDLTADEEDKDAVFKVDYHTYELFWSLQRFFANPGLFMVGTDTSKAPTRASSLDPELRSEADATMTEGSAKTDGAQGPMAEFQTKIQRVLNLFSAVAKREKELAGASAAEAAKGEGLQKKDGGSKHTTQTTGYFAGQGFRDAANKDSHRTKRQRPDVINGVVVKDATDSMSDKDEDLEDISSEQQERLFFPKYLTGRSLLQYELRDVSFRKHFLAQCLVLLQFLVTLREDQKDERLGWSNAHLRTKFGSFTISTADADWIRATFGKVGALLNDLHPGGNLFRETMLSVVKREKNWAHWKNQLCKPLNTEPMSQEAIASFASARAKLAKAPEAYPHKLGTAALSELWSNGFPPPVAGTRVREDEMGNEITIATDGLEELEIPPPIPSLSHFNRAIKKEQMQASMRKRQLNIDPEVAATDLTPEDRTKLDQDEDYQRKIEASQSLSWRALRIASRDSLHLFADLKQADDIAELVLAMDKDAKLKSQRQDEATTTGSKASAQGKDERELPPLNGGETHATVPDAVESDTKAASPNNDVDMADASS